MKSIRSQTAAEKACVADRAGSRWKVFVMLAGITVLGLTQTGCRSGGCSNCNLGSKLSNGVQALNAKIFSHRGAGGNCSTCGTLGGVEEGVMVESGVPMMAPGSITIPPPATLVPSPSLESAPRLEAIPSGPVGEANAGSANRAQAGANRSAYEALAPVGQTVASRRNSDLSRAYESSTSPTQAAFTPLETDVFDHLPPVDLPADLTQKTIPVEQDPSPGTSDSPPPIVPVGDIPIKTSSVENHSTEASRILSANTHNSGLIPGMERSSSVAPMLAGGSLPGAKELAWLNDKGYRTLVDLRSGSDVKPDFADQVTDNGLLYVALPFVLDPISLKRFSSFLEVINRGGQHPIYFCDNNGRRAGLLWYLKLRYQDHESSDSAQVRAEEVGFQAADLAVAEQFLKMNVAMGLLPIAPLTVMASPSEPELSVALLSKAARSAQIPAESEPSGQTYSPRQKAPFSRSASWKPITALVLGGLGVPLAYWSRAGFWQNRSPRRASLTARALRPHKSLPSSDA